ncbi:MAG: hypothetical protein AAGB31_11535 [Bdellovibrio sp.]
MKATTSLFQTSVFSALCFIGSFSHAANSAESGPSFSCSQSSYSCGENISCSARGSDDKLQGCDPSGCFPLLGRSGWQHKGAGHFEFQMLNKNPNGKDAPQEWSARDSQGKKSKIFHVNIKACPKKY